MAQVITLDEQQHIYRLPNGEEIPSVSEIIRFIHKEIYGDLNQFKLDRAAERGKSVHRACEVIDKYGEVECDEITLPYVQAYVNFMKETKKQWAGIEVSMQHPTLRYAGTLDRFEWTGQGFAIWDIKTTSALQKNALLAQLNGYRLMAEIAFNKPCTGLFCLHLKADGTFKEVEIPMDDTLFMACYQLHKAFERKRRKKT